MNIQFDGYGCTNDNKSMTLNDGNSSKHDAHAGIQQPQQHQYHLDLNQHQQIYHCILKQILLLSDVRIIYYFVEIWHILVFCAGKLLTKCIFEFVGF